MDTKPIHGLMANLWLPNQPNTPLNDDRPYLVGSGLISKASRYESLIGGLYRSVLAVMGILAFVFVILPFVIRRPAGGEKVRIDPRLLLILALTGIGFMFIEMAGIFKFQHYLHHPILAMIVVLSSMILGAGLGSLHSGCFGAVSCAERRVASRDFRCADCLEIAIRALIVLFFLVIFLDAIETKVLGSLATNAPVPRITARRWSALNVIAFKSRAAVTDTASGTRLRNFSRT